MPEVSDQSGPGSRPDRLPLRTDLASEGLAAVPWPVRWVIRFSMGLVTFLRVGFIVGGTVGLAIGAATLDGRLVAGAVLQVLIGAFLLRQWSSNEAIDDARGPGGDFIIRTGPQPWSRQARTGRGALDVLIGRRTWQSAVRRRQDDPFGTVVWRSTAWTQRDAQAATAALVTGIAAGQLPVPSEPLARGPAGPRRCRLPEPVA